MQITCKLLKNLNDLGIVNYTFENSNSKLSFLVIREDEYTINSISKNVETQHQLKYEKLMATISFIRNKTTCRNIQLLSYFNEYITENCEKCDVCKSKNKSSESTPQILNQILMLLAEQHLSSQELSVLLKYNEKQLLNSIKILLEKNKIAITSQNKFKLRL